MTKTQIIIEHLKDAIEQDRKILSGQWKSNGKVNVGTKARHENNQRKLDDLYFSLLDQDTIN